MVEIVINRQKEQSESAELPSRIDTGQATITKPELIKAYKQAESAVENKQGSIKNKFHLHNLKTQGDNCKNQNKLIQPENKPSQEITLAKLNKAPLNITSQKAAQIIENIYNGDALIQACKKEDIPPKDFIDYLDYESGINTITKQPLSEEETITKKELKKRFMNSRVLLAEWYLNRREELEQDLKSGKIDTSTYSALSSDYKYLAGKLAPLAYGEKIQLDAYIAKDTRVEVISPEKIKELNALLN